MIDLMIDLMMIDDWLNWSCLVALSISTRLLFSSLVVNSEIGLFVVVGLFVFLFVLSSHRLIIFQDISCGSRWAVFCLRFARERARQNS
jgi:hypothetical protein